ncbi:MAG: hypothetical protein IPM29_19320 [Planctomycetes bacterium]|nr:hypothetical protein [Planctomycetota bacterium]
MSATSTRTTPTFAMVRWPLLLTAVVLFVRLGGELAGLAPSVFSREPGGGMSPLGIVWLVPIFGLVFGWRRTGERDAPDRPGLAAMLAFAGLAIPALLAFLSVSIFKVPYPGMFVGPAIGALIGISLCWRGWPGAFWPVFVYSLVTRILVSAITLLAGYAEWDTHFTKVDPKMEVVASLSHWQQVLAACGFQAVGWLPVSVAIGMVFAVVGSVVRGRRPDDRLDD